VAGAGVTFGLCWGWWMACFGLLGVGVVERDKSDLIGVGVGGWLVLVCWEWVLLREISQI